MDVLYDNLENFNEENTIAQLRDENRDLKFKIEEYSEALDKLQKEFDRLTSEHKKLEINYSSLLKTARAEIERKTQIISKLNTEKDAMVLNSIQNRNTFNNRRKATNDKAVKKINANKISIGDDNIKKPGYAHPSSNESRVENHTSSENMPNTNSNLTMKLVDTVNRVGPNTNMEAKENMRVKDDLGRDRALIKNRRKSMPVFSMGCEKFSSDDEATSSVGSTKNYVSKDHIDANKWDQNKCQNEKPSTVSKISGHYEPSQEALRRQSKQYDSDKYRSREKLEYSQKYKRNRSSDRIRRGTDHSEEHYQRQEYERHRKDFSPQGRRDSPPRGRRNSPPKTRRDSPLRGRRGSPQADKLQFHHRSRETQRTTNERNYSEDFDRYKSRTQDKYPMKHKISHELDQPSSKRMKTNSLYQYEEERWRNERHVSTNSLDNLHNMSCQSPDDYIHTEAHQQHQIREIKLHATSKLDDPRISSKKYVLKTCDGKPELSTVDSAYVDVKVIDTTGWKMKERVKMPDALIQRPVSPDKLDKVKNMKIAESSIQNEQICNEKMKKKSVSPALIRKKKSTDGNETVKNQATPDKMSELKSTKDHELTKNEKPYSSIYNPKCNDELSLITKMGEDIQKHISADVDLVKEVYMDIDNPLEDISMESGELFDFDSPLKNNNSSNKEVLSVEPQKGLQKLSYYKIPKKTNKNNRQITDTGILPLSNEEIQASGDQSDNFVKLKDHKEAKINIQKRISTKKDDKLSQVNTQIASQTAQEIIEGDLELSDDDDETKREKLNDKLDSHTRSTISGFTDKKQDNLKTLGNNNSDGSHETLEANVEKKDDGKIVEDDKKQKARKKSPKRKEIKDHTKNKDVKINLEMSVKKKVYQSKEPSVKINELKINNHTYKTNKVHQTENNISTAKQATLNDEKVKAHESIIKEQTEKKNAPTMNEPLKRKEDELQIKKLSEKKSVVSADSAKTKNKVDPKDHKNKNLPENTESVKNKETVNTLKESVENTEHVQKKGKRSKSKEPFEYPIATTTKNEKDVNEKGDGLSAIKKSTKKKESKIKLISHTIENTTTITKPVGKREKADKTKDMSVNMHVPPTKTNENEAKPKEVKTKFCDLFGDSTSLISPEDLGLLPVSTVAPIDNYMPIFEDAQDASDLTTIRGAVVAAPMETTKDTVENAQGHNVNVASKTPSVSNKPMNKGQDVLPPESASKVVEMQEMYQNLQPVPTPKEDVVKTIIISTGVQQQSTLATNSDVIESDSTPADLHVMQCVKPIMQALATSTPHKIGQQNEVPAEIDQKSSNSKCDLNESQEASADNTPVIDKSDNNTINSQNNPNDVPDVRIFVRRRRKVVKK